MHFKQSTARSSHCFLPLKTKTKRTPLLLTCRQSFRWAGFPGVDKEAEIALGYLQPAYGSTIIDMSCGSGLFARRFLSSGRFPGVIAADFSESMLQEALAYFQQVASLDRTRYLLLRADVARLPFATGSSRPATRGRSSAAAPADADQPLTPDIIGKACGKVPDGSLRAAVRL